MSELTNTQATSLAELSPEQKKQLLETYKKQTGQDLNPEVLEILLPGSPMYTTLLTILKANRGSYGGDTVYRDFYQITHNKATGGLQFSIYKKEDGEADKYSRQYLFPNDVNNPLIKTSRTPLKEADYYLVDSVESGGKTYYLYNNFSNNIIGFQGVLISSEFGATKSRFDIENGYVKYCNTVQAHAKSDLVNEPTKSNYPVSALSSPQFPFAKKNPDEEVGGYIVGKFLEEVELYGRPTDAWVEATKNEETPVQPAMRKCSQCIENRQYSWSPDKDKNLCSWRARVYFLITHFIVREPLSYHEQTKCKLVQYPLAQYDLQPVLAYYETGHVRYNTLFGDNNAIPCNDKEGYVKLDENWLPLAEFARQAVKATRNFRLDANLFPEEKNKGIQKTWDITENMYYITPIQVAVGEPENEKTGLTLAASVWHDAEAYGSKLEQLTNFGWILKAGGTNLTYPEEELIFNKVSTFYNPENDEPVEDLLSDVEFDVDDVEVNNVEVIPEEAEEEQLPSTRPLKQPLKRSVLLPE